MCQLDCVISVVTYQNPPEMILEAIRSCLNSSLRLKIYIVDNSPSPKLEAFLSMFPVEYCFMGKNLGFGKAHNWVLSQGDFCTYRLILNPDVSFKPGTFEELKKFMDLNADVGAIMPKVLNVDGTPQLLCRKMPNPWILFSRRFLPDFFKKKWKGIFDDPYELAQGDCHQTVDVPYIPGCFLLTRASVLEEVGGFDERFFMYMEDVDLCRRIRKKYRVVYHPLVQIYHGWQRQSYKSLKGLAIHIQSAVRYFNKWGWI